MIRIAIKSQLFTKVLGTRPRFSILAACLELAMRMVGFFLDGMAVAKLEQQICRCGKPVCITGFIILCITVISLN